MRHTSLLLAFPAFVGFMTAVIGPSSNAGEKAGEKASKQTFSGEYQWSQGGDGALEAEFRPNGENQWKIKFRFKFNKKNYTWKGTASGSLEDGTEVQGTAKGGGGRIWEFEGAIQDGLLIASHAERWDGELQQPGTFKISR